VDHQRQIDTKVSNEILKEVFSKVIYCRKDGKAERKAN
jgi:hypothetical protein